MKPQRPQNQQEMNAEARRLFAVADAELNRVYAQFLALLPDDRKASLKAAQRAWVAFRDAEGRFHGSEMAGGSAEPLVYEGARRQVTLARIKDFKTLIARDRELRG